MNCYKRKGKKRFIVTSNRYRGEAWMGEGGGGRVIEGGEDGRGKEGRMGGGGITEGRMSEGEDG